MESAALRIRDLSHILAIPSLLEVVCRVTGLGVAVVAQVDEFDWVACAVRDEIDFGLSVGDAMPVVVTPCFEVKERRQPVVIDDLAADPAHAANPVLQKGHFRSYISAPIFLTDGSFFGTLCALGTEPAHLDTPEITGMFRLFANLVGNQIDSDNSLESSAANLRRTASRLDISETERTSAETDLAASSANLTNTTARLAVSDAALLDANATAALREQFVAILGHDLRNPLSSLISGLYMMRKGEPLDEKRERLVGMMERSAARMNELVRNMLDFASVQLGGGIRLNRQETDLAPALRHVVDELQSKYPGQSIVTKLDLEAPVNCDADRIGQMLSNLLGNALTHGAADRPVTVHARETYNGFELCVANGGTPIPPDTLANLFKPYMRGSGRNVEGLGLGLYIAAGIAQAHGGTLTATSNPEETRFTFRMR